MPATAFRFSVAAMTYAPPDPEDPGHHSYLDGFSARIVALLILLGMLAALGWLHRETLFPFAVAEQEAAAPANPALAACLEQRVGEVERMAQDGTINAEQATLFKQRAEALCHSMEGDSGPPPPPQ